MAPRSKHKGSYGSSLVAVEKPSLLKMQAPWDEQQEQKEQEGGVNQSLEKYRGQRWKTGQSLWRSRVDHGWIPDIDVILETPRF